MIQVRSNTTVDNHVYYTSKFYPPGPMADSLWIDLTDVTGVVEDLAHNISDRYRFFAVSFTYAVHKFSLIMISQY